METMTAAMTAMKSNVQHPPATLKHTSPVEMDTASQHGGAVTVLKTVPMELMKWVARRLPKYDHHAYHQSLNAKIA